MRKILFWTHLTLGVLIGLIVLFKCATGVVLVFEDQVNAWNDARNYRYQAPDAGTTPLSPEALLNRVKEQKPDTALTGIILHANRDEPAEVWLGRESTAFVNPFTGEIVGQGSPTVKGSRETGTRGFFRKMEDLHRWLSLNGRDHDLNENIGSVANVMFAFILFTGIFIWFPRKMTWQHFRPAVLFKRGAKGKARDWNWHNVIGIWAVVPLFLVVMTGVTLSYQWASNLFFYRATGSPQPRGKGDKKKGKKQQAKGGPARDGKGKQARDEKGGGPERGAQLGEQASDSNNWDGLDRGWSVAQAKVAGWKTIQVEASANPLLTFEINTRDSGQAQRSVLRVRRNGEVAGFTDFATANTGEKLRLLSRDIHTGEVLGFPTELVMGAASAGGGVLVYTGIALALRRLLAWRKRRARPSQRPAEGEVSKAA